MMMMIYEDEEDEEDDEEEDDGGSVWVVRNKRCRARTEELAASGWRVGRSNQWRAGRDDMARKDLGLLTTKYNYCHGRVEPMAWGAYEEERADPRCCSRQKASPAA